MNADGLARLAACVRGAASAAVCYSGGVDSALVLAVAHAELGERVVAFTAVSDALPADERAAAAAFAARLGVAHVEVVSREGERPGYRANEGDRCFHCREELFTLAAEHAHAAGLAAILDGTQLDDLGEHRPGLRAAAARGVRHPLVEAGLGKAAVRELARSLGLPMWDKPAAPCLASRLVVGTPVTPERLRRVAAVEADLHARGFRVVRVRVTATPEGDVARVEVGADEIPRLVEPAQWAATVRAAAHVGLGAIEVDPRGYRRGAAATRSVAP